MQVFTFILCTLLVFLVSGCWFFGGFYFNFWKACPSHLKSLRNSLFLSQNTSQEKSILKCLRWQGGLGGTPWAHWYAFKLVINRWAWALVPTKLVEPGNALVLGGGIHGNPVSGPHQAPSHWTIQWNTYWPILTWPSPQEGGRDGKSKSTKWHTNNKLLQQHFAKNWSKQLRI